MAEAMASDSAATAHQLRQAMRLQSGRPALALGVRTALATVLPLVLAPWIGHTASAWASTGGFIVALADKGGSYRTRAAIMGGVTLASALSVVAGAFAAPYLWAAAPLMLVVASVCGFGGVLGPAAASGGVTVAVLFAVSLASPPSSPLAAILRGAAILGAGAWAMGLALLFWPIRVYKPSRYAVARVDRALAAHARKMASFSGGDWSGELVRGHGALRATIEQARTVLAATRRGRLGESGRGARLLVLLQVADQLLGTLVALEELLEASPARAAATRALDGLAAALDVVADRTEPEGRLPPPPPIDVDAASVRAAGDEHAALLIERMRGYVELAFETTASLHEERPPASTPALALPDRNAPPRFADELRGNLTLDSVLARHALRVGTTAMLAVLVARALGVQRGYWVTLTALIILQPYRAATLTKALQRVAGTVGGAVVAALILATLHSSAALLVVATLLAGVSAAVLQVNYALFALFLTPTFVLLAELGAHDWHLAEVRIVNTLVGGVLAFVASRFFWPHHERDHFPDELGRVGRALADYIDATARVLAEPPPAPGTTRAPRLPPWRRALGLRVSSAEATFERVLGERGVARTTQEALMTMLLYARRIGGTLGATASLRSLAPAAIDTAALDAFTGAASAWLRALADAVEHDRAPPPPPDFDALARPFAGNLVGQRLERLGQQLAVFYGAAARAAGKIGHTGP